MIEISVKTKQREELIDVTEQVRDEVRRTGVNEGLCHLYVPHTTCAVTVNEGYDPAVRADVVSHLALAIPKDSNWRHEEGNSDAHVKSILVGQDLTLPISDGNLRLGRWQAVFFCEFDGPRERTLWLTLR